MESFPGGSADPAQLHATMFALEQACSSIQMHVNPAESEKIIYSLRESPMPYMACRFILDNSQLPNARFQAAGVLKDAAIREWGILTDQNKISLILFCLCYVMEHASAADSYVQSKVSSVAAQLIKRGWQDFNDGQKVAILSEVKQAVMGIYGTDAQYSAINFIESLVSEFSPLTSSAMGLPAEFHEQCCLSFEADYLKEFYCWAQRAASSVVEKVVQHAATESEERVCSSSLRLMFQIMSWDFKQTRTTLDNFSSKASGIRYDITLLKKYERSLVQPGFAWHDVLISSGHIAWLLNLYGMLREKYAEDVLWIDSPLAVSARQLIVQLCSLAGSIFPSEDNGEMQVKHLRLIVSAVVPWIYPPDAVIAEIRSGKSESEMLDGCHVLLSIATLTTSMLFENLLRSLRPFGTLQLLSSLTCEVVKTHVINKNEEETWLSEALDILLETWSLVLGRVDFSKSSISAEGMSSIAHLFRCIVESHLNASAQSAFDDDDDSDYFVASVLQRDERLRSFALIARAAADVTVPFLIGLFAQRVSLLSQGTTGADHTSVLEELYWFLLMAGHVLTDSGEGETVLVPEALLISFLGVLEEAQHPVVVLSWSILEFARRSLDAEARMRNFSPRLMEAVVWFLARWVDTYLMPLDSGKEHDSAPTHGDGQSHGELRSRRMLLSFAGDNDQGKHVLDITVRVAMTALTFYAGEFELQGLTCNQLLVALVRRRNVCAHLVTLDSWRDLATAFAHERSFSLSARLQRSLARALVCAACGMRDPEASNQYVRDLMGPTAAYIVEISARSDLRVVAQQADAIYMVSCLLERLRGAERATQPRTQKGTFEIGQAVMKPLLILLEAYKNQSAVVYLILKFVVGFVDAQVAFLNAKDTALLVSFCLRLLQIYSSHNIGKVLLTQSISLQNEAQTEKYKDIRALLQLLTNICSKDLVDFSSSFNEADTPDIAEVIYVGLHIVTPLISLDLLKYPKLSHDYFALISHMLEVYPEKVSQLSREAFTCIVRTLDFGVQHQDTDIVDMCLRAINALASYHYKEKLSGQTGLGTHVMESQGVNGEAQESSVLGHFLQVLLQLLLSEDFRMELASSTADALFPLLLCEQNLYQGQLHNLLERQTNPVVITRLANAFHALTSSNQLSFSLDRINRQKFRKNIHAFLTEISGFMRIF